MTTLIFETPSKGCPLRPRNGQSVTVEEVSRQRVFVRRLRKHVNYYMIQFPDGTFGFAYPDELHITP